MSNVTYMSDMSLDPRAGWLRASEASWILASMGVPGPRGLVRTLPGMIARTASVVPSMGVGARAQYHATMEILERSLSELSIELPTRRHGSWLAETVGVRAVAGLAARRLAQPTTHSYGPHGRANTLEVWGRGPRKGPPAPIVLQIPGGAWVVGNCRTQAYPLLNHLHHSGMVSVAMNYRLAPRNPWPAHIHDVKRAIVWVRNHAEELGADPNQIILTGGSAGGHLTALAALTENDPSFQPGFEDADTSVAAAIPMYGRYDWASRSGEFREGFLRFLERTVVGARQSEHPEIFDAASPILRTHAGAPPMMVVHGSRDALIPIGEARDFHDALTHAGARHAWVELPGAQHCLDLLPTGRAAALAVAAESFIRHELGRGRSQSPTA